jgi:predicted PurR-regulated permease PerM
MNHVYAFFRGQMTVACVMAVLYWLGLWMVGLPWAFVVGMVSGLLNVVPYLGIAIGAVLATIITLVTEPTLTQLILVWAVFASVQLLEGFVLTPKIVGEQVGIHSLTVIIALIIGGQLFGFAGLILAIPGAAALKVLVNQFLLDEVDERPGASTTTSS